MNRVRKCFWLVNQLIASVCLVLVPLLSMAQPAHAQTCNSTAAEGFYPYSCFNGQGSDPSRSTWCEDTAANPDCTWNGNDVSGPWFSPFNYGYRNCTDYVAWRASQEGISIGRLWGNGGAWASNAASTFAVNTTPAKGAIAQWNNGGSHPVGHVAYVDDYSPTAHTVTISDYNYAGTGVFSGGRTYNIDTGNDRPQNYIHIEQGPLSTAPGGWWLGPTPDDGAPVLQNGLALQVNVHGLDNSGQGLQKINITWQMGANAPWSSATKSFLGTTTHESDYGYFIPSPTGGWPPDVIVSFDVFSLDGRVHEAPQGMRRICKVGVICPKITAPGKKGGGSSSTSCTPGANQVVLYTDANYQGDCVVKTIGEYRTPSAVGLPNDSISSIKAAGTGANAQLCDNADLNSPCEWFNYDDPDLSNNSIGTNTVSSVKVEGGQVTTNCQPNADQVAFFDGENYGGSCVTKGVGTYNDPGALLLPNDSISSIKVGDHVKTRVCNNSGMNSPCEFFDYSDDNLANNSINTNTISSAAVEIRGYVELCDGTNYGGPCKLFGAGTYNMQDYGFRDTVESVHYSDGYGGLYHTVLYSEDNQTGNLAHYDNSNPDIGPAFRNHVRSIKIYKNDPPAAAAVAPANGTVFAASTTSVGLDYGGGDSFRVHVWGSNGYDYQSDWAGGTHRDIAGLTPGQYSWQVQGHGSAGDGPWSSVATFSINTPPQIMGGELSMEAGSTQTIQAQAIDADQSALTLTASNVPAFASFTDNHDGTATITLAPSAAQAGSYAITVTANDGSLTGSGTINIQVTAPAGTGYQAQYYNNVNLSGTPVLSRSEQVVNNDWGSGGPGSGVNADNFSARWSKTATFTAGTYTFSVTADDGVRLYIDGALAIDKWIDQGATTYTTDKTLAAGTHTIVMEYYERSGGAVAKLSYQQAVAPTPAPGITSGNTYKLIGVGSNKALNVSGGGTADGTNVQIWTDTGGAGQKWRITQNSDGSYKLTNPNSGKVLDVSGGGTANGTNVQIWTDNNVSAQKWRITQNADGTYRLINPNSNKALDVSGGGAADGTNVQIWTDNASAAQQWRIIDSGSSTPPATPSFTGSGTAAPASVAPGGTVTLNASFTSTSSAASTTRIHLEVRNPSDQVVFSRDFDNENFAAGQTKSYTASWTIPQGTATGAYVVKGGAVSADWSTWYLWSNNLGSFSVTPAGSGTELLTSAWNLSGNNGASELYQSIASNALAGKTTVRITYNLHGLQALGGDASALIFDQNGWKYVSLSSYGQNGLNGSQTVDIPLSAFGLNLSQPVGTLHTRFWYSGPFTVDITSVKVL